MFWRSNKIVEIINFDSAPVLLSKWVLTVFVNKQKQKLFLKHKCKKNNNIKINTDLCLLQISKYHHKRYNHSEFCMTIAD